MAVRGMRPICRARTVRRMDFIIGSMMGSMGCMLSSFGRMLGSMGCMGIRSILITQNIDDTIKLLCIICILFGAHLNACG